MQKAELETINYIRGFKHSLDCTTCPRCKWYWPFRN